MPPLQSQDGSPGVCHPPIGAAMRAASAGPHELGSYVATGGGDFSTGSTIRHSFSTSS